MMITTKWKGDWNSVKKAETEALFRRIITRLDMLFNDKADEEDLLFFEDDRKEARRLLMEYGRKWK